MCIVLTHSVILKTDTEHSSNTDTDTAFHRFRGVSAGFTSHPTRNCRQARPAVINTQQFLYCPLPGIHSRKWYSGRVWLRGSARLPVQQVGEPLRLVQEEGRGVN